MNALTTREAAALAPARRGAFKGRDRLEGRPAREVAAVEVARSTYPDAGEVGVVLYEGDLHVEVWRDWSDGTGSSARMFLYRDEEE